MADDNHVVTAATAVIGLGAFLGLLAAVWRWIRRAWRALCGVFKLEGRVGGLDGRVGAIERDHVTQEELNAMQTQFSGQLKAHEHRATKAIEGVQEEMKEIRSFVSDKAAKADDLKRVEGKLDRLLVQSFPKH